MKKEEVTTKCFAEKLSLLLRPLKTQSKSTSFLLQKHYKYLIFSHQLNEEEQKLKILTLMLVLVKMKPFFLISVLKHSDNTNLSRKIMNF
jgi:hypothetical protein